MKQEIIPFDIFIKKLLEELSQSNISFLIGAGVSMLPPCSLPSGAEIKDLAVSTVCKLKKLQKYWLKIQALPKYQNIIPEILFQRLYECLGTNLYPFFDILRFAKPNLGHKILASLSEREKTPILTTNFDLLIDENFEGHSPVLHLHGHINNKEFMTTRINQVGRGLRRDLRSTVRNYIESRVICILGYSGNDNDIRQLIKASKAKYIMWLVRNKDDRAWSNFEFFKNDPKKFLIAEGDLAVLFSAIEKKYELKVDIPHNVSENDRFKVLHDWSKKLSISDRYACISKIFLELEEYTFAHEALEQGFNYGLNSSKGGWFKTQLAYSLRMIGDFNKMEQAANESIELNKAEANYFELANAYKILGLSMLEKASPNPTAAVKFFRDAISNLRKIDEGAFDLPQQELAIITAGQLYNNLGLGLLYNEEYSEALNAYKKSLAFKKQIGDLIGISQTCINISLLHYEQRNFKASYHWRKKAINLTTELDLKFQSAYLWRETGRIACEQGRLKVGINMLKKALFLYEQVKTSRFGIELTQRMIENFNPKEGLKKSV